MTNAGLFRSSPAFEALTGACCKARISNQNPTASTFL